MGLLNICVVPLKKNLKKINELKKKRTIDTYYNIGKWPENCTEWKKKNPMSKVNVYWRLWINHLNKLVQRLKDQKVRSTVTAINREGINMKMQSTTSKNTQCRGEEQKIQI